MSTPRNRPRAAAQLEQLLQAVLGLGARWRAGAAARRPWTAVEFRGRRCHCDPAWRPHFVHSEGLREACDFVVDFGTNVRTPGRPLLPVAALAGPASGLAAGATVHVKADLLDAFVAAVLPALRAPVVLVTGDSDTSPLARHRALLEHPKVAHWFAQNCDVPERHPRLTRIPIGLDNPVFTKLEKRLGFALTMLLGRTPWDAGCSRNDIGDQGVLQAVRKRLPPTRERPARVLCTFHQNQKIVAPDLSPLPERAEAARVLGVRPDCHFVAHRLRQRACWERHGEYAFEASPRGNGLDCFRTWEALALGTIPIVRTSPLDALYRDEALPVVIVESWEEITPENLKRWHEAWADAFTPEMERRLSLEYWVERIKKVSRSVRGN